MLIEGLIRLIMERNCDPVVERMLSILNNKLPENSVEYPELEKLLRSLVINALSEAEGDVVD